MQHGVSADGVQLSICKGHPYGGKNYSLAEREAACEKFEQITGLDAPQVSPVDTTVLTGSLAFTAMLLAIGAFVFLKHMPKKTNSRLHKHLPLTLGLVAIMSGLLSLHYWQDTTYDVIPVQYGPSGLHMVTYERIYAQIELLDIIIFLTALIAIGMAIAVVLMLTRRTKKPVKKAQSLSKKSSKFIS